MRVSQEPSLAATRPESFAKPNDNKSAIDRIKKIERLDGREGFNKREEYVLNKMTNEELFSKDEAEFEKALNKYLDEAFDIDIYI